MNTLLEVRDLRTVFDTYAGEVKAVNGVSFSLQAGEAMAVVGESGCGKSVTALSIMRLLASNGRVAGGQILLDGRDLSRVTGREMRSIRGNEIGIIFQDPMTSLNPVLTIGTQIAEGLELHQGLKRREATQRAIEMLRVVGIPNPERRIRQYPHEFSGGMRQRVMVAIALACNPKLLIADEPTTALDVTIQAQILELMKDLKRRFNMAIILITHDLGVVAGLASRVLVMYAGKIIEQGPVKAIYRNPQHPYTWGLLRSIPRLDAREKKRLVNILGTPPDLLSPPLGCPFYPRCEHALKVCETNMPETTEVTGGHLVACWLQHPMAPRVARREGSVGA